MTSSSEGMRYGAKNFLSSEISPQLKKQPNNVFHGEVTSDRSSPFNSSMRTVAGVIFKCSGEIIKEAEERMLLGATSDNLDIIHQIHSGTPIFILDLAEKCLLGGFEAASDGRKLIEPTAWTTLEQNKKETTTPFPAQVRIRRVRSWSVLGAQDFEPILHQFLPIEEVLDPLKVLTLPCSCVEELCKMHVKTSSVALCNTTDRSNDKEKRDTDERPPKPIPEETEFCNKGCEEFGAAGFETPFHERHKSSSVSIDSDDSWPSSEELSNINNSDESVLSKTPNVSMTPLRADHHHLLHRVHHNSTSFEAGFASRDTGRNVQFSSSSGSGSSSDDESSAEDSWSAESEPPQVDNIAGMQEHTRKKGLAIVVEEDNPNSVSFLNPVNTAVESFLENVNSSMNVPQPMSEQEYDLTKYSGNDAHMILHQVQNVVSQIYGTATVQIYGSFATGLWLPGQSDLDLLISFQRLVFPSPSHAYFSQPSSFASADQGSYGATASNQHNQSSDHVQVTSATPSSTTPKCVNTPNTTKVEETFGNLHIRQEAGENATEGARSQVSNEAEGSDDLSCSEVNPQQDPSRDSRVQIGNSDEQVSGKQIERDSSTPIGTYLPQHLPHYPIIPGMMMPSMHMYPMAAMEVVDIDRKQMLVYLYALHSALKLQPWCKSIKLIRSSSMPVIKMIAVNNIAGHYGQAAEIPVDISFRTSDHYGMQARDYVLQLTEDLPGVLRPMVLVLKRLLREYNLNDVYKGGLGSYSLTALVAFFLLRCGFCIGNIPEVSKSEMKTSTASVGTGTSPRDNRGINASTSPTNIPNSAHSGHRTSRSNSVPSFGSVVNFPSPPMSPIGTSAAPPPTLSISPRAESGKTTLDANSSIMPHETIESSSQTGGAHIHQERSSSTDAGVQTGPLPCQGATELQCPNTLHGLQEIHERRVPVFQPDDIPPLFSKEYLASLSECDQAKLNKAAQAIDEATSDARSWLREKHGSSSCEKFNIGLFLIGFFQMCSPSSQGGVDFSQVELLLQGRGGLCVSSQPAALCIRDPVLASNCLGSSSFQMSSVQQKFFELRDLIMLRPSALFPLLSLPEGSKSTKRSSRPAENEKAHEGLNRTLPPRDGHQQPISAGMIPNFPLHGYIYPFMTPMMQFPMHLVSPLSSGGYHPSSPFSFAPATGAAAAAAAATNSLHAGGSTPMNAPAVYQHFFPPTPSSAMHGTSGSNHQKKNRQQRERGDHRNSEHGIARHSKTDHGGKSRSTPRSSSSRSRRFSSRPQNGPGHSQTHQQTPRNQQQQEASTL